MAHFAKIGLNNKIIEVLSVHNNELLDSEGVEQEVNGIDFLTKLTGWAIWKQTSYNNNFRKNYAGIGFTYVLKMGPLAYQDHDKFGGIPWCEQGQWVLIGRYAGARFSLEDDSEVRIINDDEVIGTIMDPDDIKSA